MIVKYDLDVISESTRWQCQSFLSIAPWNMDFLFKCLHVIVIFFTSVLKNFEVFETFPSSPKPHNYIPKKEQKLLCKGEELASYEASVLFLGCLWSLVKNAEFKCDRILHKNQNITPWNQPVLKTYFHLQ